MIKKIFFAYPVGTEIGGYWPPWCNLTWSQAAAAAATAAWWWWSIVLWKAEKAECLTSALVWLFFEFSIAAPPSHNFPQQSSCGHQNINGYSGILFFRLVTLQKSLQIVNKIFLCIKVVVWTEQKIIDTNYELWLEKKNQFTNWLIHEIYITLCTILNWW